MNLELLRRLTTVRGIAGFEQDVRDVVRVEIEPLVDEVRVDRLGNLIAKKRGTDGGPTILIAAHMDEIGFLVRHVDDRGFLRLQPLGSFDPRVLIAQRVHVHTADGDTVPGTIETSVDPLHFASPEPKRTSVADLFVDVGTLGPRIEIGDMVTIDRDMYATSDRLVSRALDDRLGLYVMIEALRELDTHAATIVAVGTTQEEVGSRGAVVAGYAIDPDICIALDLTVANDIPGVPSEHQVTRLGLGPAVKVMDTTQISDRAIVRQMRRIASDLDIPLQLEVLNHGGTDASLIQRLRAGVAVCTLSIPARYIHTANETVAISDVDHMVTLLTGYLSQDMAAF